MCVRGGGEGVKGEKEDWNGIYSCQHIEVYQLIIPCLTQIWAGVGGNFI